MIRVFYIEKKRGGGENLKFLTSGDMFLRCKIRNNFMKIRFALWDRFRLIPFEIRVCNLHNPAPSFSREVAYVYVFLAEVSRPGIMTFLLVRSNRPEPLYFHNAGSFRRNRNYSPRRRAEKNVVKRIISRNRNWNFQT